MSRASLIKIENIQNCIYTIRGLQIMIDSDLAKLYQVEVKVLNQAVKRNRERFPDEFMFQLTAEEYSFLRSQNVTLKEGRGRHRKYLPYVFTEQGVAMLSAVLKSDTAIRVSIQIMKAFVVLRELLVTHKDLRDKIEKMERKYDQQFKVVFQAIKQLLDPPVKKKPKRRIGF